ncbi:MAG: type III pantothenate kinase, partial [Pseudomonadota bacterium]|nr:type III pantothenate kinase [Pseudomonadota bacterium]
MLLAIDVGNTNTVFAVYDGETQLGQWRAETRADRTADEYAVWLLQLLGLAGIDHQAIGETIISSVVPETVFNLRTLCQQYYGSEPLIIGENADVGAELAVDTPPEVGAARVGNAGAAHSRYPGALIIIDVGTATTFDGVDGAG